MRREDTSHLLLPNTPLKYLVPHRRALVEVCLENQPRSLDRSEILEPVANFSCLPGRPNPLTLLPNKNSAKSYQYQRGM